MKRHLQFRTITTPDKNYVVDFSRELTDKIISVYVPGTNGALQHVMDVPSTDLPNAFKNYASFRIKIVAMVREVLSPTVASTYMTRNNMYVIDFAKLKSDKTIKVQISVNGELTSIAEITCPFLKHDTAARPWVLKQLYALESYLKAKKLFESSPIKLLQDNVPIQHKYKKSQEPTLKAASGRKSRQASMRP